MISILLPSRDRPERLRQCVESARRTALAEVQIVVRLDEDEPQLEGYQRQEWSSLDRMIIRPRVIQTAMWNECSKEATGDIQMLCGDDILFRTADWDQIVEEAFDAVKDKILLVYGDDGSPNRENPATHSFLHKRWIEVCGRFTAPYFSADYADRWLWDIAQMIGRSCFVPILTEHMHPDWGKSAVDRTMQENMERRNRDNVAALYESLKEERVNEAEKLKAAMEGS